MQSIKEAVEEYKKKLIQNSLNGPMSFNSEMKPEPKPPCSICNGNGLFLERGTGKTVLCDCERGLVMRAARNARLREFSEFPARLLDYSIEGYEALPIEPEQRKAAEKCRAYIQNGGRLIANDGTEQNGLYLCGPVGTGKSGLAAAVANAAIEAGVLTLYRAVPDLLDYLRSTFAPAAAAEYDETFEQVKTVDLLVLDDLGTEKPSAWVAEKLVQIIDYRYREGLRLIVTSNLDLAALMSRFEQTEDQCGQRIVSRLAHMCALVNVSGKALR